MNFNVNSTFLYGVAAVVIVFVLAQSVFFLIRAFSSSFVLSFIILYWRKYASG